MNRAKIEQAVSNEIHNLLLGKVEFATEEDFKITDEEFLHS
jgi:hypothetical protein